VADLLPGENAFPELKPGQRVRYNRKERGGYGFTTLRGTVVSKTPKDLYRVKLDSGGVVTVARLSIVAEKGGPDEG
jgi:hypothetical protein